MDVNRLGTHSHSHRATGFIESSLLYSSAYWSNVSEPGPGIGRTLGVVSACPPNRTSYRLIASRNINEADNAKRCRPDGHHGSAVQSHSDDASTTLAIAR